MRQLAVRLTSHAHALLLQQFLHLLNELRSFRCGWMLFCVLRQVILHSPERLELTVRPARHTLLSSVPLNLRFTDAESFGRILDWQAVCSLQIFGREFKWLTRHNQQRIERWQDFSVRLNIRLSSSSGGGGGGGRCGTTLLLLLLLLLLVVVVLLVLQEPERRRWVVKYGCRDEQSVESRCRVHCRLCGCDGGGGGGFRHARRHAHSERGCWCLRGSICSTCVFASFFRRQISERTRSRRASFYWEIGCQCGRRLPHHSHRTKTKTRSVKWPGEEQER